MTRDEREYPFIDEAGNVWFDAYGFKAQNSGSCIICHGQTNRVDINLLSFFCNRAGCLSDDRYIALRNGYDGEYDKWDNSGGSLR